MTYVYLWIFLTRQGNTSFYGSNVVEWSESVLGPLLFLFYINDITDNLGSLARLFADDTSLSYFGRNYEIMKSDINNDLSKLNEWESRIEKEEVQVPIPGEHQL
jgi:hypothetical protein